MHRGDSPFQSDENLNLQKMYAQEEKRLEDLLAEEAQKLQLGATGKFREGKIAGHDEGGITRAITIIEGFGPPIAFIGFNAKQALALARLLKKHAKKIRKGRYND